MTMPELKVEPQTINRYVAERIAESAIGEALAAVIKDEVTKLTNSYNNPMKTVVEQYIRTEVTKVLREEYTDYIRTEVKRHLTDEVVEKVTQAAFDAVIRGIR